MVIFNLYIRRLCWAPARWTTVTQASCTETYLLFWNREKNRINVKNNLIILHTITYIIFIVNYIAIHYYITLIYKRIAHFYFILLWLFNFVHKKLCKNVLEYSNDFLWAYNFEFKKSEELKISIFFLFFFT